MTEQPRWPAVILAAGGSTRFGPLGPKALARVGPETVVARLVRVVAATGFSPIRVVVGRDGAAIAAALPGSMAEVVPNPRWESGRTGSIQAGLEGLDGAPAALLWPVDAPFVRPATVASLRDSVRLGGLAHWWTPTCDGRGGHPILLAREALAAVRRLPPDFPLRVASFRGGLAEVRVPVDDPAVLDNTNTPEAFRAAALAWRDRGGDR